MTGERAGDGERDAGPGPGSEAPPLPRVRVTSERSEGMPSRTGIDPPDPPVREAGAVFVGGLVRSQLRLALGCLAGFLLVAGALTAVVFVIAQTGDPVVVGVPLSWLLQAYGYYPVVLFFAIVYARGATRNEQRYRAFSGRET